MRPDGATSTSAEDLPPVITPSTAPPPDTTEQLAAGPSPPEYRLAVVRVPEVDSVPAQPEAERRRLDVVRQERAQSGLELARRLAWQQFRQCGRTVSLEDLTGEAYFALAYAASLYDERKGVPFGAYATLVIRHRLAQAVTQWRRGGRLDHICFGEVSPEGVLAGSVPFEPICPWACEAGRLAENRELLEGVRQVLPERWFDVLQMHYAEGHSLEEIGQRMGISRERVRQLLGKALTRARNCLNAA